MIRCRGRYGSSELVPEPAQWQDLTTSARFLQPVSNDMGQYTTRAIQHINISCVNTAAVSANPAQAFDLYLAIDMSSEHLLESLLDHTNKTIR